MGPECTAKAITHQIAKIKANGRAAGDGSAETSPRKLATPRRGGKANGGKTRKNRKDDDQDDDDDINSPVTEKDRSTLRRNGADKRSYAEVEDEDEEDSSFSPTKLFKREDSAVDDHAAISAQIEHESSRNGSSPFDGYEF